MAKAGAPTWAAACPRRSPFALATCRSSIIWHAVLPTPPPPLPALARPPPPPAWESAPSKVVAFRASRKRLGVWPKCLVRPPARKNIDRYRNCSIRQVCGKPNLWESIFTIRNGIMIYELRLCTLVSRTLTNLYISHTTNLPAYQMFPKAPVQYTMSLHRYYCSNFSPAKKPDLSIASHALLQNLRRLRNLPCDR